MVYKPTYNWGAPPCNHQPPPAMCHQFHAHGPAQHGRLLGNVPEANEAHTLATQAVHGETWGKKREASLEICGYH